MYAYCCEYDACFFVEQKTAYEMRISDWSSDVCSSDLVCRRGAAHGDRRQPAGKTPQPAGLLAGGADRAACRAGAGRDARRTEQIRENAAGHAAIGPAMTAAAPPGGCGRHDDTDRKDRGMALCSDAAMVLYYDIAGDTADHDDWHSYEHMHERLSVPGFVRATRWVATAGAPRYMVIYEVTGTDMATAPDYLARLKNPKIGRAHV